jgi:hypothetical protein
VEFLTVEFLTVEFLTAESRTVESNVVTKRTVEATANSSILGLKIITDMAEQIDPLNYCQLVPGFAPARDK